MDYQSIEFITSSITHNFKVPFFVLLFVSAYFLVAIGLTEIKFDEVLKSFEDLTSDLVSEFKM